jgi:hypothetical protein
MAKKTTKSSKTSHKKKPSRPKLPRQPKPTKRQIAVRRRMLELDVDLNWLHDETFRIYSEIDQKYGGGPKLKIGEVAGRQAAALAAIEQAILDSDDQERWLAAARAAGQI